MENLLTEYFASAVATDEVGNENEKRLFRERFQQIRPQVLQTLRESFSCHAVVFY